ncbi:helix-turn-helix domain-containing protein [Microbacterium sp. zg-Y818]|uniref:TetR/AcrR family transcriptional regulator n=1 Tax=unclassified Microbacterium TaxID=2609290 RepID=UPI00214CCE7C|nr:MULTISPECIES: TetR/AcrR family transcriptional regulator [unclassified Microbacterium]MCR2800179.1 TetR/AcrR family transcriptional regulator [Microbacterium sp. zg.Y818]WIM22147.1 helix-turn-helix domain-containing protein [Microbacterium sp. zg-Y818]
MRRPMIDTGRPAMRSDALKRRETIVREARRLFAAQGASVPLEAIAEAGGVGIATLYRNFASRAELTEAVALSILAEMRHAAGRALQALPGTPDDAWRAFLHALVGLDLGALTEALAHPADAEISADVRAAQDDTLGRVADVLTAARAAGLVRADLDPLELVLAVGMITRPQPAAIAASAPHLIPRLTAILEAGLRAATSATSDLPAPDPPGSTP